MPDRTQAAGGASLDERLREAISAAREGDKERARGLLHQLLESDPDHLQGLLWSAALAESVDGAFWFLQRLLQLDPGNEQAGKILAMHEMRESMRLGAPQPAESPLTTGLPVGNASAAWLCPLCLASASTRPKRCPRCHSITSIWELDAILRNEGVDDALVAEVAHTLERKAANEPGFDVCLNLALAHLNLKRSVDALPWLRKASAYRDDQAVRESVEALEKRKLILAVDDSPLVRRVVALILERNGYRAVTAVDGIQALARLNESIPALVLLDIEMPRMDGFQLCKVMKKNPYMRDIPVMLLTGNSGIQNRLKAKMAGAVDYLLKPLDELDLLRALAKHLNQ
ncbi:MAG: response regulator [Bryobacteraceae bacterium]